jgi:hypothetical protein
MIEANLHDANYPPQAVVQVPNPKTPGRQLQTGPRNFLRKPPAPEAAIASADDRLGIQLPEDFKAFLRLTNGFAHHNYPYDIDVINGTEALNWGVPLIEEYTLNLLPESDTKTHPDIEGVKLDRIIPLNDTSIWDSDYVYIIEPRYINEARIRFRDYYENRAETWMKRMLDLSVSNYFGGWAELKVLD